jgi:cellulose biosynthesis protein BcsQ
VNNPAEDKSYTMLNTQIPRAVAFKEATSQQIPVTKFMNDTKIDSVPRSSSLITVISGGIGEIKISEEDGRFILKFAINKLIEKYDYILIDTQGAKGNLQDAAVLAADL